MKEERKIKVVLLEPGKIARAVEIDASLENMQRIVGGYIEAYYPFLVGTLKPIIPLKNRSALSAMTKVKSTA